ncbi:MAG: hypothetical protein GWN64_07425 [Candidatus Thorarchaeota archaeon]|nr:hypothetical protein [Candidatus Thorarchaeota archaeon]
MAKTKKKKEVPEEAILFPEIEVEGVKVKPWSLGTLAEVSPDIDAVVEACINKGIDLDTLEMSDIMRVYLIIAPHAASVISKTTGIPIAEVEEFHPNKAVRFLQTIIMQNSDILKNALALFGAEEIPEEREEEEEEKE